MQTAFCLWSSKTEGTQFSVKHRSVNEELNHKKAKGTIIVPFVIFVRDISRVLCRVAF